MFLNNRIFLIILPFRFCLLWFKIKFQTNLLKVFYLFWNLCDRRIIICYRFATACQGSLANAHAFFSICQDDTFTLTIFSSSYQSLNLIDTKLYLQYIRFLLAIFLNHDAWLTSHVFMPFHTKFHLVEQ